MNLGPALLLGIIQGFTEFLPVSSSGHLVIVQSMMKSFDQPGVLFDVILHLGTSFAVIIYFRERLLSLDKKYLLLLVLGSIPVGIVGVLFNSIIEDLFSSTTVVGVALLFTALINYFIDRAHARRQVVNKIDTVIIGIAQAIAIVPGVSRSGMTIFAGTSVGIDRKKAAEFSFILSIPAILGASVLELASYRSEDVNVVALTVGFIAAFIAGLAAISVVIRLLVEKQFKMFAIYTAILGILTLVFL